MSTVYKEGLGCVTYPSNVCIKTGCVTARPSDLLGAGVSGGRLLVGGTSGVVDSAPAFVGGVCESALIRDLLPTSVDVQYLSSKFSTVVANSTLRRSAFVSLELSVLLDPKTRYFGIFPTDCVAAVGSGRVVSYDKASACFVGMPAPLYHGKWGTTAHSAVGILAFQGVDDGDETPSRLLLVRRIPLAAYVAMAPPSDRDGAPLCEHPCLAIRRSMLDANDDDVVASPLPWRDLPRGTDPRTRPTWTVDVLADDTYSRLVVMLPMGRAVVIQAAATEEALNGAFRSIVLVANGCRRLVHLPHVRKRKRGSAAEHGFGDDGGPNPHATTHFVCGKNAEYIVRSSYHRDRATPATVRAAVRAATDMDAPYVSIKAVCDVVAATGEFWWFYDPERDANSVADVLLRATGWPSDVKCVIAVSSHYVLRSAGKKEGKTVEAAVMPIHYESYAVAT